MNLAMFIVGAIIFSVYVAFLMWNIFFNHNKNKEENYPGYYVRHNQPEGEFEVKVKRKRKYKKDIVE
jgi:heme/copper-type cytochrome/quinol oxidase subunit 2